MESQYETLAPAGSIEQLQAAVNNGCDSVYLGLSDFNARMKAPNFTKENLAQWVDYCHLFGVKVYVTVNTSVKNDEFAKAVDTLLAAYRANVDGIIVTDLALLAFCGKLGGNLDVVASTQLNCHDKYGAEFLQSLGATTIVCARECTLDDIRSIASTGVKVECFIHGALCVCQSGQCLFSSVVGGNSGNRGLCAQPCRNFYTANNGKSGYLLSAADLNGLEEYADLQKAGAGVFKIEGRNRSATYSGVCSRAFARLFADGKLSQQNIAELAEVYKRGNVKYLPYLKGNNDNIIYTQHPNHMGRRVGVVKNGKVFADVAITKGDGLKVFDGNKEVCGGIATESGTVVKAEFSAKVKDGMIVCRTSSVTLTNEILSAKRTIPVQAKFVAKVGQCAELTLTSGDVCVVCKSDFIVQKATNAPTNEQEIAKQLQKTGDSYSTITDIICEIDDIFIAKSQLNQLRRTAIEALQQAIVANANKKFADRHTAENNEQVEQPVAEFSAKQQKQFTDTTDACIAVTCKNAQEVRQAYKANVDVVIYKPEFIDKTSVNKACDQGFVYLDLPSFCNLDYIATTLPNAPEKIGVVCHNVGHVEFARQYKLQYILGRGMNIYNDNMLSLFDDRAAFVFSYELTLAETRNFAARDGLIFIDGQIPLMQLVHCPYKVCYGGSCATCKAANELYYTDKLGNDFVMQRRRAEKCTFELLNGKKLSVVNKLKSAGRYLVDYDQSVVQHYANLNNGQQDGFICDKPYTKGRLYDKIN